MTMIIWRMNISAWRNGADIYTRSYFVRQKCRPEGHSTAVTSTVPILEDMRLAKQTDNPLSSHVTIEKPWCTITGVFSDISPSDPEGRRHEAVRVLCPSPVSAGPVTPLGRVEWASGQHWTALSRVSQGWADGGRGEGFG